MILVILQRLTLLLAAVVLFCTSAAAADHERKIFEKNSVYQYISVWENDAKKERYIRNNRRDMAQGGVSMQHPDRLLFPYTQLMFIGLAFLDRQPQDALFVGVGAGSMPRYMSRYYPAVSIDAVEIDPDILDVARKWFWYKETPSIKTHVSDGRTFVKRTQKRYDIIFLDAYQSDYIPFHLTTAEYLKEVKAKLKDGGVVVSNILAEDYNKFFDSMLVTYRKVFPQVYVFKMKYSINYVFVATADRTLVDRNHLIASAQRLQQQKNFDFNLYSHSVWYGHANDYVYESAEVLTDDFAPVNLYKYQKSGRQPK